MFSLVIHGHFYQPPRENPFLDEVEAEASAAPFHDWNQRIERECYRAVVAARVPGPHGRIQRIVNTLEWISFNFGPTLLEWMEREAPDTYAAILAADRTSAERSGGHGNAIAQPYHHTILPLASRRDKVSEVRWGVADFRRRFGREPEGMWLPETAVDDETLDVLAHEGIRFTIVAPHQVASPPPNGQPGIYRTASGRSMALCVYDGALSHGIAFGGLLHDAGAMTSEIASRGTVSSDGAGEAGAPAVRHEPRLVSAATDGETYGHHHKFGEMALARALEALIARDVRVENFASFIARVPPRHDVVLVQPTSWSCAHGIERWRSDCGCRVGGPANPSQAWRAPLRRGLERLALDLHAIFERDSAGLLYDPWAARDAYGSVVAAGGGDLDAFARSVTRANTSEEGIVRARELLEMERDALRMFTSCAWFFDDIAGLEPRQVLRYAARAMWLAGPDGARLESSLLDELSRARSNDAAQGTGREVYLAHAKPRLAPAPRLAAAAVATGYFGGKTTQHFTSAQMEITGEVVRVRETRTGRAHEFRATFRSLMPRDVVVELRGAGEAAWRLTLDDLPERPRLAVRYLFRLALLPRCFSRSELEQMLSGEVTLTGLIRVALTRAIARLDGDPRQDSGQEIPSLVSDLLDLMEQTEMHVPFAAQTAWWRVWQRADAERRAKLAPLGARLGFEPEMNGAAD